MNSSLQLIRVMIAGVRVGPIGSPNFLRTFMLA